MSVARSRSRAAHFPLTLTESPMEFVGQPSSSGACSFLALPGLSSLNLGDDDGEEIVIGIRPKSSPLPRRRSSLSDDDSEAEPPPSRSRRVSFADAKGLNLVQVKEFGKWDVPMVPGYDYPDGRSRDEEEYFIAPLNFSIQLSSEELFAKVHEQKVELESIELLPGTTILKGMVRVLNVCFSKAVYVRTTLDNWARHFDLLAEYIPGSSEGMMDSFSFKLTLVPPFEEFGTRVDFCLRYETTVGTFWNNNNNMNYVLLCHQRIKEQNEKLPKEIVQKKSCLKTVSQNFDTVENIPSPETSQQENVSADVSKHGADVITVTNNQTNGTPKDNKEENRQKLQVENRVNQSRRNRRKAARMARLRDYYAQRAKTANDSESDASLSQPTQTAEEESPVEKHSVSEVNIKSEDSLSVSESRLATCCKSILDVQHHTSKADDYASNNEAETFENISVADSATSTGAMSDSHDDPLPSNDEPACAEHEKQHINKSVSKDEQRSPKPGMSYECANPPGEPHDSLVSQTNSYSFGTVVAPLYHQVFVRAESESGSVGDIRNPVWATLSDPHTGRGESSSTQSYQDSIRRNMFQTQKINQECTDNEPYIEDKGGVSVIISDSGNSVETKEDLVENRNSEGNSMNSCLIKPNIALNPQPENIIKSDLMIAPQRFSLEGETQEDGLTQDLQETTAKAQALLPENTCCSHTCEVNMEETLSHPETELRTSSLEKSRLSFPIVSVSMTDRQNSTSVAQSIKEHDLDENASLSTSTASSGELLHDDSGMKGHEKTSVSCLETIKQADVRRTESSLETSGEVMNDSDDEEAKQQANVVVVSVKAELVTEAAANNCHTHSDMFVKLEDKGTLKDTEIIFPEKVEHDEMEPAASKEESNLDSTEVKNWEIMVEEEERDLLTGEDESEALILETEDVHRGDDGQQWEGLGLEISSEHREDKSQILVEDKERVFEEELKEILKELVETTVGRTEEDQEEHLVQPRGADIQGKDTTERGEMGVEEEINVTEDESDVKLGDQFKAEDDPGEEKEKMLFFDAGEVETKESGGLEVEHNGEEERLDNTQNKVKDHLCALVNNVHEDKDGRAIDREDTGEGHTTDTPPEMNLYKQEHFQRNDNITHHPSQAAGHEEGGSCLQTDEPETDDGTSSESGSDDEVELYMHCLRAVHGQHSFTHAARDQNKDKEFSVGKRLSGSRCKLASACLPSISESLDEEQHLSQLQDSREDTETADSQPTAPALSASSGEENINRNTWWRKETFSCSNISKTLLYATLLVLFLAVAYHYDFLACFGLYLISVVWLCCQGERQMVKNNSRVG